MREECVINIRDTWIQEVEGHQFRYPVPEGAKDFYFQGFCRCNDSSMDFMGWYGLVLMVQSGRAVQMDCTVTATLCEGEPLSITLALLLEEGRELGCGPVEELDEKLLNRLYGMDVRSYMREMYGRWT